MDGRVKAKGAPGSSGVSRNGPARRVKVTLRRSLIGRPETQRRIIWTEEGPANVEIVDYH